MLQGDPLKAKYDAPFPHPYLHLLLPPPHSSPIHRPSSLLPPYTHPHSGSYTFFPFATPFTMSPLRISPPPLASTLITHNPDSFLPNTLYTERLHFTLPPISCATCERMGMPRPQRPV